MRIQETDRILKEAKHARKPVKQPRPGLFTRAWRSFLGLFGVAR